MEPSQISHYRIGRMLGRGGMGEVYEAEDLDLGRQVALKFIAPELAADPQNLKRFEHEARAAASLNHPNIATLYAFERAAGRTFIAMELVPGESLRARLRRGPLPLSEALVVAHDIAAALSVAHRRGIIHRDIKPENLMFGEDGRIRVMDFGLARAIEATRLTMTGSAVGTAAYMSPESVRGQASTASDVFALGIVLYEMLTGDLPFAGDSALALMFTIVNEPPRALRERRPGAPEALDALVHRLLAKDTSARPDAPSTARELAAIAASPMPADADSGIENLLTPSIATDARSDVLTMIASSSRAGAGTPPGPLSGPSAPRGLAPRAATEELEVERRMGAAPLAPAPGGALVPTVRKASHSALLRGIGLAMAGVMVFLVASRELDARRHRAAEAVIFNNLGQSAFLADSLDRAHVLFSMAIDRTPDFAPALINLGQLYRHRGLPDSAALMFSHVMRKSGKDHGSAALASYGLAQIDLQSGALDGAAAHLESSLAFDSTRVEYYNDLGWALASLGRGAEAQHVLELGLTRFSDSPQLRKNLALALSRRGDLDGARAVLAELTRDSPTYSSAWGLKAVLEGRLGERAAERKDWAAYVSLSPDSAERAAFERERSIEGVGTTPPARPAR
ncbi:MAG: protein kinase domain-containing protein [Candidatus Eiseniibacteriota bacterium]